MEQSISVAHWREENGLRVRLQDNVSSGDGDQLFTSGYQSTQGITAALNVEFTFPGGSGSKRRKDHEMKKFNKKLKLQRDDNEALEVIGKYLDP